MLILKSPNSGTFRHFHFTSVLSAFGSTSPSDDKLVDSDNRSFQDGDALQRLFHACQGKDILAKLNSESSVGKFDDMTSQAVMIYVWKLTTYAESDLARYDCLGTSLNDAKLLDHADLLVPVGSCSILYAFSSAYSIRWPTADI